MARVCRNTAVVHSFQNLSFLATHIRYTSLCRYWRVALVCAGRCVVRFPDPCHEKPVVVKISLRRSWSCVGLVLSPLWSP